MSTRRIQKVPAALEDFSLGFGTETQNRNKKDLIVRKISASSLAEAITFASGATLTKQSDTLRWSKEDGGDGGDYYWTGSFPKTVAPDSTPDLSAGWRPVSRDNKLAVDSLIDLLDVPFLDGKKYTTDEFYPGLESMPEKTWYAQADYDQSLHNVGTVLAIDALEAWKTAAITAGGLTATNLRNTVDVLLNWTGTGTGCYVYKPKFGEVLLEDFGAYYDGSDDSLAIKAALKAHNDLGYKIIGKNKKEYTIGTDIVTKNIDFDGHNCLFKLLPSVSTAIRASLGWQPTGGPSSDNNLVLLTALSADFSAFSSGDDNQVQLSDVTGIEAGQVISIVSNDVLGPDRPFVYKRGITSIVQKVSGNTVYLEHTIPYDLTASGSRVVVFTPNEVVFKNAKFEGSTVEDDQRALVVDGAIQPIFENLRFDILGEASLTTQHCIDVVLNNVRTGRAWWNDTQATSYGYLAASTNGVYVDGLRTFTGRHGFATGAFSYGLPIDTSNGDTRGAPCMNIVINKSKIYPELGTTPLGGGNHNGLDCHGGTKDITINDSEIYRFQLSVDKAEFNSCTIKGQAGTSSFIGLRPLANGNTSFTFNDCILDPQQIALSGADSSTFTDPLGLTQLVFNNCQSNLVALELVGEVKTINANSVIRELTIDGSDRISINAHDTTNLRIEHLNILNLNESNARGPYALSGSPFGSVGNLYISNVQLEPDYNTLFAQMAETVHIDSIKWTSPEANPSVFRATFSDASDIYITNTRLNFGTGSTDSVIINEDAATEGGGTWYSINSPILINGGAALISFGFTSVTEL